MTGAAKHTCQPPLLVGMTIPCQPDWTCGECGRIWRDWSAGAMRYWAEIRGPKDSFLHAYNAGGFAEATP